MSKLPDPFHRTSDIGDEMIRFLSVCAAFFLGSCLIGETAAVAQSGPSKAEQIYAELARLPPEQRAQRILDGARQEGHFRYVNSLRGTTGTDMNAAFQKRYPFLKSEMSELGSQDASERLVAEEATGRHLTDMIIAEISDLTQIRDRNLWAAFPTPATKNVLPQYHNFLDPENHWIPFEANEHGIIYNTNLVKTPPKNYEELCDPKYKGQVSFDPLEVRYLVGMYKIFDDSLERVDHFIKCMSENDPIIQRGHEQRYHLMIAGDHAISPDQYFNFGYAEKRKVPDATFAADYDVPLTVAAVSAIINRNAENLYAAALFTDWTLSPENQDILFKNFRGPVAGKHPFFPDNAKIIAYTTVSPDVEKALVDIWRKYMRGK